MKGKELLGGVLLGTIIGAALGLLLAPRAGEETREVVRERARELGEKMKDSSRSLLENGRDLLEQKKSQTHRSHKAECAAAGRPNQIERGRTPGSLTWLCLHRVFAALPACC